MKYLLAIILFALSPLNDLDRIATINALKKEAKAAYSNGDYETALKNYQYLVDSMEVKDDNILLNLANAYYKVKDTTNAMDNYQVLTGSNDKLVRSVAQQQLGVMANKSKKFDQALEHFKEAIKANPANEDARYNYELLKKLLKEQEQQNKDKNKDQDKEQDKKEEQDKKQDQEQQQNEEQQKENKEQQQDQSKEGEGKEQEDKQDQKPGEEKEGEEQEKKQQEPQDGEESDEENQNKQDQMSSLSDKLKDMKISEEKAKMILQALRNKEIQYYQQNKRKAKKPKNGDKPDW